RARVARDERHLSEAVPGAEDGHPLASAVALAAYLDRSAHDHVERISRVALGEHGLAGGEVQLVELADEACEDLAREIGEERDGSERRDDGVHRRSVAGTLDAPGRSVKARRCRTGLGARPRGRVFSREWNRSTS